MAIAGGLSYTGRPRLHSWHSTSHPCRGPYDQHWRGKQDILGTQIFFSYGSSFLHNGVSPASIPDDRYVSRLRPRPAEYPGTAAESISVSVANSVSRPNSSASMGTHEAGRHRHSKHQCSRHRVTLWKQPADPHGQSRNHCQRQHTKPQTPSI